MKSLAPFVITGLLAVTAMGADLELLEAVRKIASDVTRLRGESFDRPPVAVRAPDEMREVSAEIRAFNVLSRERLEARGRAWADLGLGRTASPALLLKALAGDLAGIAFDPQGNRLLVAPDRLTKEDFGTEGELGPEATVLMMTGVRVDEPLVAHSLMHVRQLEREGSDLLVATTDAMLARSAWAEGEANLVAVRYLFEGMNLADEVMEFPLDPGELLDGRLMPPGLAALGSAERLLVRFVYEEGFQATVQAYRTGGWKAVDAARARARSCRDLLHPGDSLPDVGGFPGPSPPRPGLRLADEDTLGEQVIFVLLSTLTGKDNLALLAAEGWNGDRLYRWEAPGGPAGQGVTEWRTRWSSADDATDFAYALGRTGRGFAIERRSETVRVVIGAEPVQEGRKIR